MAKKLPAGLLKGAQRVKVFSSGLDVWLYDPSFREALKASRAFEPRAGEAMRRKAMQRFVREGKLLSYGLMQDDSIDVAVAVRAPLAKGELGTLPWREPQQGYLRLPSGRLVVESNDALTLRRQKPTDAGAEIGVPPGDYMLTLHRVDWDVLAEDEIDYEGPSEFITLTGGAEAKPVPGQPESLPWERPEGGAAAWKVEQGAYAGAAIFDDDLMALRIAIGAKGISLLGLKDRSVTLLRVPALGFECALVWIRGDRSKGEYYDRLERLRPPAACAGKEWAICNLQLETPGDDTVFCLRRDGKARIARKFRNAWHPATLAVLAEQALERR